MQDNELQAVGPPNTFDNTMLSYETGCPRQLYWFLRRIVPIIAPAYFTFGRAFGQGINVWHASQGSHPRTTRIRMAKKIALKIWNEEAPIEKDNDNLANLLEMIELYAKRFPRAEQWKTLAIETGFRLLIPGTSFYYGGALDSYLEWPGLGLLNREDKTTGAYITENYINQWSHATQITGYQWALSKVVGEEIFGTLMNIASKRGNKVLDKRFVRFLEKRSEWKIARFMKETVSIVDRIRRRWSPKGWDWPRYGERNPINCAGGMGRSPCPYRILCLLDMEPWNFPENYDFKSRGLQELSTPWTPWEREGEDR